MTDTGIVDEISTAARARAGDTEHEESFMASFTRAEIRLFVITFAGTLAASVLTVVVVGLGLLVVRVAHDQHDGIAGLVIPAGICGATTIIVLTPVLLLARRTRKRALDIAGNVAAILIFAALILGTIGYLAGIK